MMTLPQVDIRDDVTLFEGGLDQVTPTFKASPGALRESINWECDVEGGYRYPDGYERFDGQPSPSSFVHHLLYVTTFQHVPTVGQTVIGLTSGTDGQILALVNTPTQKYMVLWLIGGSGFQPGETILVGATTIGVATSPTILPSPKEQAQYVALAAEIQRATITSPPTSLPIRGVVGAVLNGRFDVFCFLDEPDINIVGAPLRTHIYRATTGGWIRTGKYMQVPFEDGDGTAPTEGQVVKTLQLEATIRRVVLEGGSWTGGTARGRFILDFGANLFPGVATAGNDATMTILATPIYIAPFPGGSYQFDVANFKGQFDSQRIYGCDGVNPCFEFDGEIYVPLWTGLVPVLTQHNAKLPTLDRPSCLKEHHKHLLIGLGSSVMNSGLGTPYNWTAEAGAAELATGQPVTNLEVMPGNQDNAACAVFNRNKTHILYGTSAANWKLVTLESNTGAVPFSSQGMDQAYVWDDRGVLGLSQGQNFGNFNSATYTKQIQPFVDSKRGRLVCSCVNRSKNQLRYFFHDGSALYLTMNNGKLVGASPMYFPVTFNCVWSGETESGIEVTYAGGIDGTVYQLDRGTSFNGAPIFTWMKGVANPLKSPHRQKHFYRGAFGIRGSAFVEFQVKHELGFGDDRISQAALGTMLGAPLSLPQWDHASMGWDTFTWDGSRKEVQDVRLGGDGEAIRYHITSNVNYLQAFTLESALTAYSFRRSMHR